MTTQSGALVGVSGNIGYLKLVGDVRYPDAPAIDRAVGALFVRGKCESFVIDMREVGQVDSTILGLVARVGGTSLKCCGRRAVIACDQVETLAGLRAVGFDDVFVVVANPPEEPPALERVVQTATSGVELGETMLAAHRELMELSDDMRRELEPSVAILERELRQQKEQPGR